MSDATKIHSLFSKGYKQAAFSKKSNALFFAHLWEEAGYEVGMLKSTGPTLESPKKSVLHAYYVIAKKKGTTFKPKTANEDFIYRAIKKLT